MPPHLGPGQLGGDARRAEARLAEGEGNDTLLDERAGGVGHARTAPLAWSQHLQAVVFGLVAPAVVGRVVDAHHPAGGTDAAEFLSERERALAEAVQSVIGGHSGAPLCGSTHSRMYRLAPTSEGRHLSPLLGNRTIYLHGDIGPVPNVIAGPAQDSARAASSAVPPRPIRRVLWLPPTRTLRRRRRRGCRGGWRATSGARCRGS